MKILFLSRWFPYPADNGSKIRIFNILRQLSRHHEVALLSFYERTDLVDATSIAALRECCSSVRVVPYREYRPSSTRALLGLASPQPRYLFDTFSAEMSRAAVEEAARHGCGVVVASQLATVPYALSLPAVPAILEEVELSIFRDAATRARDMPNKARAWLTWLKLSAYLRRVLPRFAACTVVSEGERENLRLVAPWYGSVAVVPNAVDVSRYREDYGLPAPNTLVFSGALTYHANLDAVRYFLTDVYPAVERAVPDITFRVTGSSRGIDLGSLPLHAGVRFTGHLPDVRPVIAKSWASVVPVRIGGGTRLKILESLALGTPVVATAKGAEGLATQDGEDLLIGDSPPQMADQLITLLRSPALRRQLSDQGRRLVESRYEWSRVGQELCGLVERTAMEAA